MTKSAREPMFNFSEKIPVWLAGILIIFHLIAYYGPRGLSNQMAEWGVLRPLAAGDPSAVQSLSRLIGHGFLHGGWSHVLMNAGMIVIFGIATIRAARLFRLTKGKTKGASVDFLQIFFLGVVGGGIAQLLWWMLSGTVDSAAIGASGGASALFAATGWAIGGRNRLIGFGIGWALINAVLVLSGPVFGLNIAWAAHMGGFLMGAFAAPFMLRPNSTALGL